jgi:hypothetical protein
VTSHRILHAYHGPVLTLKYIRGSKFPHPDRCLHIHTASFQRIYPHQIQISILEVVLWGLEFIDVVSPSSVLVLHVIFAFLHDSYLFHTASPRLQLQRT